MGRDSPLRIPEPLRQIYRADLDAEWQRKGATLSDKTARKGPTVTDASLLSPESVNNR